MMTLMIGGATCLFRSARRRVARSTGWDTTMASFCAITWSAV